MAHRLTRVAAPLFACCLLFGAACPRREPVPQLPYWPDVEAVGLYHRVQPGETLWGICRHYGVDPQEVAEVNGLEDPAKLYPGQEVFIPDITQPPPSHVAPRTTSAARQGQPIRRFEGDFIWPLDGKLTSRYGIRHGRRHDGIDVAAAEGTPIKAAAAGRVLFAGNKGTGYGNLVILLHRKDMITIYAHCQRLLVAEGQTVEQGQVIATVGNTGRSTGPHLHFEIRKRTKPRNPLFFLPRRGKSNCGV